MWRNWPNSMKQSLISSLKYLFLYLVTSKDIWKHDIFPKCRISAPLCTPSSCFVFLYCFVWNLKLLHIYSKCVCLLYLTKSTCGIYAGQEQNQDINLASQGCILYAGADYSRVFTVVNQNPKFYAKKRQHKNIYHDTK